MSSNPLQKYFRQPKLFISLPSKGVFYKEGTFTGDHSNVPIFGMTGMDEIIMRTPDALFNGEATIKVIESCCPYVVNAHEMPSLDIDTILAAVRIATYGDNIEFKHVCKNCATENDFEVPLSNVIEFYSDKSFDSRIGLGEVTVNLKPLTYSEMTKFNTENFKLQRTLNQLEAIDDPELRQVTLDQIYSRLAELQVDLFLMSIDTVQTPEALVEDKEHIIEWLKNSPKDIYNQIKDKLEANKEQWAMPRQHVECNNCNTPDEVDVILDQSNFFVQD